MNNPSEQNMRGNDTVAEKLADGVDGLGGDGMGIFRSCIGLIFEDLSDVDIEAIRKQMHIKLPTDTTDLKIRE